MENYFKMNLTKGEIDAISNLGLAHMGDCVFEILCRGYLCARGGKNVGNLHRDTIHMVQATAQAKFVDKLLPLLTEEELAVYRHGRNAKSATSAKNASIIDYRVATGFEALLGYLYLKHQMDRSLFLVKYGLEKTGQLPMGL